MADVEDELLGTEDFDASQVDEIDEEEILTSSDPVNTSQESSTVAATNSLFPVPTLGAVELASSSVSKETRSTTPTEDEPKEDLDYDEEPAAPSTSKPEDDDEEDEERERDEGRSPRSKFRRERRRDGPRRSGGPIPDSLDNVRVSGGYRGGRGSGNRGGKVLLNPNYKGSVTASPGVGLRIRPGTMYLGTVKLGGPPGMGVPPPGMMGPRGGGAYFVRPKPQPLMLQRPLIPGITLPGPDGKMTVPPPDFVTEEDWLRQTEEFLKKVPGLPATRLLREGTEGPSATGEAGVSAIPAPSSSECESPAPESEPPAEDAGGRGQAPLRLPFRTSPHACLGPRLRMFKGKEAEERTKKTAQELGLDEEYLKKLQEQRRLAEEYKRTKEAKRVAEQRQKQRETPRTGEKNGNRSPPRKSPRDRSDRPRPRSTSRDRKDTDRRRSPGRGRRSPSGRSRQVLESPSGRKRAVKEEALSRSPSPGTQASPPSLPHPVPSVAKPAGVNRDVRLPIHQRREFQQRSSDEDASPRRKRRRRSSSRHRHRRRRRSHSSSRSSSSDYSPPPRAPPYPIMPGYPQGPPPGYGGLAPGPPVLNPLAPPFIPTVPGAIPTSLMLPSAPPYSLAPPLPPHMMGMMGMGQPGMVTRPIMTQSIPQQPIMHQHGPPPFPPHVLPLPPLRPLIEWLEAGLVRAGPIRKLSMGERLGIGPGSWVAVVRGLNPATTPDRVRIIAATVAPVKVVWQPEPGVMWILFENPANAGLYTQQYNGRKLDGAVLTVSVEQAR